MKHEDALLIATDLVAQLTPYCNRIEIAGSVRRCDKPEVKDIEIVAIPRVSNISVGLFGDPIPTYPIQSFIWNQVQAGRWEKRKGGEKYIQIYMVAKDLMLDLFLVTAPAQWGVIYTIRTGPAGFSKWIVTARRHGGALPSDCIVAGGAVYRNRKLIPMPEEQDFLNFIGLALIEPGLRQPGWFRTSSRKPAAGATSGFAPTR